LKSTETSRNSRNFVPLYINFSNFGSLKSTETLCGAATTLDTNNFSNFGSLKSTETLDNCTEARYTTNFSNFGSLKSTETERYADFVVALVRFQQFRLVEEH